MTDRVKDLLDELNNVDLTGEREVMDLVREYLAGTDLSTIPKKVLAALCSKLRELGVEVPQARSRSHSQILAELLATSGDGFDNAGSETGDNLRDDDASQAQPILDDDDDLVEERAPKRRRRASIQDFLVDEVTDAVLLHLSKQPHVVPGRMPNAEPPSLLDRMREARGMPTSKQRAPSEHRFFETGGVPKSRGQPDEASSSSEPEVRAQQPREKVDPKFFRNVPSRKRRMKLRCENREAGELYSDLMTHALSLSAFVAQNTFKSIKNKREASNLARILDLIVDQLGEEAIQELDAFEVAMRRLAAIIIGDRTDNWSVAEAMEERPEGALFGNSRIFKQAQKIATTMQKLTPTKSKAGEDGNKKRMPFKKPGAGGAQD
jgi:hypothetical protein